MLQVSAESRLRARVEYLEEENRQLRDRLASATGHDGAERARLAFGLRHSEAAILGLILRCGVVTYQLLDTELYLERDEDPPGDAVRAIHAHVKRMRRKLRPHGVDVETLYSTGYRMDDSMRAKVRKILAGVCAA